MGERHSPTDEPLFSLRGIDRTFRSEPPVQALVGVDLDVYPGEYLSIVGSSGSGKSSFLNIVGLLDHPTAGSYAFAGRETTEMTTTERAMVRARSLGFVFQAFHLLDHRTALDNVVLALRYDGSAYAGRRQRAIDALRQVGLGHRLGSYPTTLSGGERQRVAIARALVSEPEVLLADEPTGNLDSATTAELLDQFDRLHEKGLTIIVVTHDDAVSERAGRVVRFLDGRAMEEQPALASVGSLEAVDSVDPSSSGRYTRRSSLRLLVDLVAEALKGTVDRPTRSLLTAMGTILGIAALVATVGLAETAGNRIVDQFNQLSATEVVVEPITQPGGEVVADDAIPWDASSYLAELNGVVAAGALANVANPGLTRTVPLVDPRDIPERDVPVVAANSGLFPAVRARLATGRFFEELHEGRHDAVAVLGSRAAERLGVTRVDGQPSIFVGGHQLTVIGILADNGVAREATLLEAIVVPPGFADDKFGPVYAQRVIIETTPGAASLIASQSPLATNPASPELLRAHRAAEPTRVREQVETDLDSLLLILATVALVVGAVGIGNVTLVGVLERAGEIGLRRALGGTRGWIALQFLLESGVIGILAGIVGASLGVLVIVVVAASRSWVPILSPWVPLAAPALGFLISLVAGAYPAWRVARIDPAQALRGGT